MTSFSELNSPEINKLQHIIQNLKNIANLIPSKEVLSISSSNEHFIILENKFFTELEINYTDPQFVSKNEIVRSRLSREFAQRIKNRKNKNTMYNCIFGKDENLQTEKTAYFRSSSIKTAKRVFQNSINCSNCRYESATVNKHISIQNYIENHSTISNRINHSKQ